MKYVASCSFGKDSLAMVLRILEEGLPLDEVIFYDTGMEFSSIYVNRDKLKAILRRAGVEFTELKSKNSFIYEMLIKPIKYRQPQGKPYHIHYGFEWCGGNCRWGTANKRETMKAHYREKYPDEAITEYVGIATDERERVKESKGRRIKSYPLIAWGMTESDCLQYCYSHGWNWEENGVEFYSILDRVSCWCCRNKNLKELKNIYLYLPEYWQKLRGLQSRIATPFKGQGKSIFELEERFKTEIKTENKKENGYVQMELF